MTKKIKAIEKYVFKSSDQLLLDTNIWLFLYGPSSSSSRVAVYSEAFKNILEAKCQIFIDALIVSEFINRYARIKQGLVAPGKNFKDFRKSKEFKSIAISIADIIALMVGFKQWADLLEASEFELELAKLLIDNHNKVSVVDWEIYITGVERDNNVSIDPQSKLEIFKQVFLNIESENSV